jgi:hypothetical protein
MKTKLLAAAAAFAIAAPAAAQITVDGMRDAAYGAATASVASTDRRRTATSVRPAR